MWLLARAHALHQTSVRIVKSMPILWRPSIRIRRLYLPNIDSRHAFAFIQINTIFSVRGILSTTLTRISSQARVHSTIGIYVKCDATTPIWVRIFLDDVCASVRCRCHCIPVFNSISAYDGTRKKNVIPKKCTETTTGMELHRRSARIPKNGK